MPQASEPLLAMADPAVAVSRALDGSPVHLVTLDALDGRYRDLLRLLVGPGGRWRMVVDGRGAHDVSAVRLAALVRLRRRARLRGGDLVLVADKELCQQLRRTGLARSLPCVRSPQEAIEALAPAAPPHPSPLPPGHDHVAADA